MSVPTGIRKDKNLTASALCSVAAIQILVGAIGYFLYSQEMGLLDRVIAFSGLLYIALGVSARWVPLRAAVVGVVLYVAFLGFQASRGIELLMTGLIFKVQIVVLLVISIVFALRRPPISTGKNRASGGGGSDSLR